MDYAKIVSDTVDSLASEETFRFMFHRNPDGSPLPSVDEIHRIVDLCRAILFPGFYGTANIDSHLLKYHLGMYTEQLFETLQQQIRAGMCFNDNLECERTAPVWSERRRKSADIAAEFVQWLPELRYILSTDIEAMYNGDPAASSRGEIISCYPTVRAVSNHRIAHKLLELGVPLIPRIISEQAHGETGIDIHPGATIGHHFSIDHGTGVVIGETCVIGDNVKIYQGVTLGARSFPLDEDGNPIKGIPRHPILEDDVVVYANATILGRITIGKGAVIGGNMWVTRPVAAGEILVHKNQ